jgi:hypothetical protein
MSIISEEIQSFYHFYGARFLEVVKMELLL